MSFEDRKTICRSFVYNHSYTDPADLAKIGQVDVQITALTKIVKN